MHTHTVIVYLVDITPEAEWLAQSAPMLSPTEQAQAKKCGTALARRQFLVTRMRLRQLLADRLNVQPDKVKLGKNLQGRPMLIEHASLYFSVTHCREHAMIAIGDHPDIGIDLEHHAPRAGLDKLVRRFFSKKERIEWGIIAAEDQLNAFYDLWTCKEALIKALGTGLLKGLSKIDCGFLEATHFPRTLPEPYAASDWQIHKIVPPTAGYSAALATRKNVIVRISGKDGESFDRHA